MVYESNAELNPYTCLGLMPGSSSALIKRRYRQLAKQYHPDCNEHAVECEEKLLRLNIAYAYLSDPARKTAYDTQFGSVFNPVRVPQPVSLAYQRRETLCTVAGLTLLMLVSIGFGVLVRDSGGNPQSAAGLFTQASGSAHASADLADPVFSLNPTGITYPQNRAAASTQKRQQ